MVDNRKLNIVDESGNIIGEDTRENIHKNGLLHREIHVWFYTPTSEIIFQHRAKDKDTYPDLLDATVGGHVEIGFDYEETALQESQEETGTSIGNSNFIFLQMTRDKTFDIVTNKTNNAICAVYVYRYDRKIDDLKVEKGKAIGFELWPLEKLFNISDEDKKRFIPYTFEKQGLEIFIKIKKLI